MKRTLRSSPDEPGQDSFLDIVANLVGILIILVMVVGVRAKDALLHAAPDAETDVTRELAAEVEDAERAAEAVESEAHRRMAAAEKQQMEIDYRREERNRALLMVTAAKESLAKRRRKLDASQQAQLDLQKEIASVRTELDDLEMGRQAALQSANAPTIIEHLPTPMAKTVFGTELRFRLSGSRLAHVPWDELVKELEREAQQKAWRLKNEPAITETIGPIGGFWMKYTLKRTTTTTPSRAGTVVRMQVELDHFVLIPVSENLGEKIDQAFLDGSELQTLLDQHPPGSTTVTIWTYSDSFSDFRALKQHLFQLGYLTACRPVPDGQPIGGSPQGTRSAAQ